MTASQTVSNTETLTVSPAPGDPAVWHAVLSPAALPPSEYYAKDVPILMSREQEHLFSSVWREGDRESMADIESGQFQVFDSDDPDDVVRWLLDAPEDD